MPADQPLTLEAVGEKVNAIESTLTEFKASIKTLVDATAAAKPKETTEKKGANTIDLSSYESAVMSAMDHEDPGARKKAMKAAMEMFEEKKKKEGEAKAEAMKSEMEKKEARIASLEAAAKLPKITKLASMYAGKVEDTKLEELKTTFTAMSLSELDAELAKVSIFVQDSPAVSIPPTGQTPYQPGQFVGSTKTYSAEDNCKMLNGGIL